MKLFRKYPELKTAIVNLKSGSAFRGVVYQISGQFMILKNADLLSDRGRSTDARPLDGEVAIQLVDIDFLQVL